MEWDKLVNDLPYSTIKQLYNNLDTSGKWRDLAGQIGYSIDEIGVFALAIHGAPGSNSPTADLLAEWGHSCPTLRSLYKHLKALGLKKAYDIIGNYVKAEARSHGRQYTRPSKQITVPISTDSSDSDSETRVMGPYGFQDLPGPPVVSSARRNNIPNRSQSTTSDNCSNNETLQIRSDNNHTQKRNNFNVMTTSPYQHNSTWLPDPSFQHSPYHGPRNNLPWQDVTNHQPHMGQDDHYRMPHPGMESYYNHPHQHGATNMQGYTSQQQSQGMSYQSSPEQQLMLSLNKPTSIMTSISALEHTHKFQYEEIRKATYGFDEELLVGKGGFGEVYKGVLAHTEFAIKKLLPMDPVDESLKMKYMTAEVEYLLKFRHKHLIPLAGYSADGPELCLVYEYMVNGSLEDRLKDNDVRLSPIQRCQILQGSASGIQYLHNLGDKPLIHGDIKSANILLDQHFEAKLCDFGQARMASGGSDNGEYTHYTLKQKREMFIASKAYLPPEFTDDFQISIKGDTYSFGIVICECCTGEPAEDEKRHGGEMLKTYIDNSCGIDSLAMPSEYNHSIHDKYKQLCDKRVDQWTATEWYDLFLIGRDCITERKKHRPLMADVLERLEVLLKEMQTAHLRNGNKQQSHEATKVEYTGAAHKQLQAGYPTHQHVQGPPASQFHDPRQLLNYNQPNMPMPQYHYQHRKSDPRFSFSLSTPSPVSPPVNVHFSVTSPNCPLSVSSSNRVPTNPNTTPPTPLQIQSMYDEQQERIKMQQQQHPARQNNLQQHPARQNNLQQHPATARQNNLESEFSHMNLFSEFGDGRTSGKSAEDVEVLKVTVIEPSNVADDSIVVNPISSDNLMSLTGSDIQIHTDSINTVDQRLQEFTLNPGSEAGYLNECDDALNDEIIIKSFPSFVHLHSDSSDNYSTGSDRSSLNGEAHDRLWSTNDEIQEKSWPMFMHQARGVDNEGEYRGRRDVGYKTLSLDADIVRNCDRYRLFDNLNEANKRCHSDPGVYTPSTYKGLVMMKKSTLSGPRTVSFPSSPPIYTPQSKKGHV